MDLNTLEVRVNALLRSLSSGNHRDSWMSSTAVSSNNFHELPGIQMTDSSVYHDIVAPAFNNVPGARDVPTHAMFTSQSKLELGMMSSTFISQHPFKSTIRYWLCFFRICTS